MKKALYSYWLKIVAIVLFIASITLGALVACLIGADLSIILSDVDGLYDANPAKDDAARLIRRVERIDAGVISAAGEAGSSKGSGGMVTKVRAARVLRVGAPR